MTPMKLNHLLSLLLLLPMLVFADEIPYTDSFPDGTAEEETIEPVEPAPVDEVEAPVPPPGDEAVHSDELIDEEAMPGDTEVEPLRLAPSRPRVDPDLRKFYLKGRNLGSVNGPRAVRKPEQKKKDRAWKSEIEVGATGYRGNTDSELLLLRLKTERKKEFNSLRFEAKGSIGNKDGERDRENGEAVAAMRRELKDRWYYTAEVNYFTDKIADVDYQVVSVLSPGYEFIRQDDAHLALELGPAYIAEKKGGERDNFAAVRLAILMDKLIDERILVWESFQYLPAIEDPSVYLLIAEVGVESIFNDWFRLRTVLQTRYDSNPAEDKEKQDIFLTASLVTVF